MTTKQVVGPQEAPLKSCWMNEFFLLYGALSFSQGYPVSEKCSEWLQTNSGRVTAIVYLIVKSINP